MRKLAEIIMVTEDTVINCEIRDIKPEGRNLERAMEFIKGSRFKQSKKKVYLPKKSSIIK